jgi:hypothetical protein
VSEALIWMLRAFGAGFGIGTVCAEAGVAPISEAAISTAQAARRPGIANRCGTGNLGVWFNAVSCLAAGHFTVVSAKGGMFFP